MSIEMYEKLKLKYLNTTSIPHVVGASGESLGARGRTKCEVNINGRIFYQMFIVCEHLKRPIILHRDNPKLHWYFMDKNKHMSVNTEERSHCRNSRIPNTIQSIHITEKEHQNTTTILHSSRCRHQHYRENQSRSHP